MVNRLYLAAKKLAPKISCSQLQFQDFLCPLISWHLLYQLLSFWLHSAEDNGSLFPATNTGLLFTSSWTSSISYSH